MKFIENLSKSYARFISRFPYLMLLIVAVLVGFAIQQASSIENENSKYDDMIPDTYETIRAINVIGDNFGGTASVNLIIQTDPQYAGSGEPRTLLDPDVIKYTYLLEQLAVEVDDVVEANSAAGILESANDGVLPKSKAKIRDLVNENQAVFQYISRDQTLSIVKLSLTDSYDSEVLVNDLRNTINYLSKPGGISVDIGGEPAVDPVINEAIGPDMQKTSNFSLLAILIILLVMMRSIRFAAMPLVTIGVGVILAFGLMALNNMNLTPQTSGVISMIMGIGIDFGIQTVTRFRQERKKLGIEDSLAETMGNVFIPMSTTTIAALIGFKAMTMGELTLMAELGTVMSYGVAACYIAALTILPAMIVLTERFSQLRLGRRLFGNIKRIIPN